MSQSSTPFTDSSTDPFLPSIKEHDYTQAQIDALFTSGDPVFSSAPNSDVLDDFDFTFDDSLTPFDSSNTSAISTPDFSSYSLSRPTSSYPIPSTESPHPYFQSRLHPSSNRRPRPIHTSSDTQFLLPDHPPANYTRRRSLSTNDADRIAAPPNPTFMRLQAPRSRSTTPDREEKRRAPYTKHARSRSQGPGTVGPRFKNAVPVGARGRERMGTPIGTPLNEMETAESPICEGKNIGHRRSGHASELIICHMDPRQLGHSQRIIQIGAMATRKPNSDNIDPSLDAHSRIAKMLDVITAHPQLQADPDALKGINMIRAALAKVKLGDADRDVEPMSLDSPGPLMLEAPSKVLGGDEEGLGDDGGLFGGFLDENDFMGMLLRENESLGNE